MDDATASLDPIEIPTKPRMKDRLTKIRRLTSIARLERLLVHFSPGERLGIYLLTVCMALGALGLVASVNNLFSTTVPTHGGTLVEGSVGTARLINPLLTVSQSDEDITQLIYSGLMRVLPDGSLIPDLAESYTVSEDGTVYTFVIRQGATFHDGTPVTSADVAFTVKAAQNPEIKSSHRADWDGVSVSTPDTRTVVFKLPHAYAPFVYNTTVGILPSHLWTKVPFSDFHFSNLNTHPIGSGPYRVASTEKDETGAVTRYNFAPFKDFTLGVPYLENISFIFYSNENDLIQALNDGTIDSISGIAPSELKRVTRTDLHITDPSLPRIFGVFLNQNRNVVLADAAVREALNAAIDKQYLLKKVFNGFGIEIQGPLGELNRQEAMLETPTPLTPAMTHSATSSPSLQYTAKAREILKRGGWTFDTASGTWKKNKQTLAFSLSTADEPELVASAHAIADMWRMAGINVSVGVYPISELHNNVIRPRSYDAIFFGEVIGRERDLFAFWHSSQRNDPGLNLALYANAKADTLLSNARTAASSKDRIKQYTLFEELVAKDHPAVFVYSPDFIYLTPREVRGITLGTLSTPSERFSNVYEWYTDTERVWNLFARTRSVERQ